MSKSKFKVEILDDADEGRFQKEVESFLNDGYKLEACSIGFVNSEQYDFCSVCKAILVKEIVEVTK